MMPTRSSFRLLSRLLVPAACLLAACSTHRSGEDTAPETQADAGGKVEVRNLGFPDMTIYVISQTGNRVRVGDVTGNSTKVIDLSPSLVRGGDRLRFLADPIGGGRTPVSEELFVAPGDTVTLTIPPQ